jgi:hypothetical protein
VAFDWRASVPALESGIDESDGSLRRNCALLETVRQHFGWLGCGRGYRATHIFGLDRRRRLPVFARRPSRHFRATSIEPGRRIRRPRGRDNPLGFAGRLGISLLQAFAAGIGLWLAGVPGASVITFGVLIFGIIQIGPSLILIPVIVWSWFRMETMTALIFTAYMVPVNLLDNILRPIVMGRGLATPMPVIFIGVVGGALVHGLIGLFIGPIVLAVAWELLRVWIRDVRSGVTEKAVDRVYTRPP